ncbi:MAG: hypothetical protein ACI3VM_09160 [Oscillospiraceae bacterium]
MNDFDFDVMTKKRIARGASARKCGSKSRRCTLPSDYLTDAQKKARNGKLSTYNLSKPMTYKQFKLMPRDLQREYLLKLRNDMHASTRVIALMFGCSEETVRCAIHELDIGTGGKKMFMSRDQLTRWQNWLLGDAANTPVSVDEPMPDPEEQPNTEPENKAEPIAPTAPIAPIAPIAPTCSAMQGGKLRLTGTAEEILDSLRTVFAAMGATKMDAMISFNLYRKAEVQK